MNLQMQKLAGWAEVLSNFYAFLGVTTKCVLSIIWL